MSNYFLEIRSDASQLITVEEFVNYAAAELQLGEDMIAEMLLIVTEATTNAIRHANKNNPEKTVSIRIYRNGEFITISIKDQGAGFDPDNIPDPTTPENILKDHGRGLFLMRTYAEDVRFNITPEGTETILMLKIK
ncbi:MAG: ATP-binding protein [Ignavibacteriaceae bacterium]|nr:ATP-binding protein [Ignavibacteriaceae bacterium]